MIACRPGNAVAKPACFSSRDAAIVVTFKYLRSFPEQHSMMMFFMGIPSLLFLPSIPMMMFSTSVSDARMIRFPEWFPGAAEPDNLFTEAENSEQTTHQSDGIDDPADCTDSNSQSDLEWSDDSDCESDN